MQKHFEDLLKIPNLSDESCKNDVTMTLIDAVLSNFLISDINNYDINENGLNKSKQILSLEYPEFKDICKMKCLFPKYPQDFFSILFTVFIII
ncbi:hypothetical protein A3Q56_06275 [Intoshia linei]|uniref:Uncharacterized protein n=1 Tax=Intoshia linei TaxID=1819745 RepID=A0A177AXT8_9BILA|nr:hypothetical protein A3Q56_06275 [Intoshia linei]